MSTKQQETLADFTAYCNAHPDERFWQALRNWSKAGSIWYFKPCTQGCDQECAGDDDGRDTFYFEGKDK